MFANALDVETDRKKKRKKKSANKLLPAEVTLISIPYLSGSALSTSFWGLTENVPGVPATAQTPKQHIVVFWLLQGKVFFT